MTHLKILFLILISGLFSSCSDAKPKADNSIPPSTGNVIDKESGFIQQKITENLYVLKSTGYNTNIGVFIGAESLLLVDPMSGMNNHEALLSTIKKLSDKPIKYVINTHNHMDHSGANSFFKQIGATIISQENAKYSRALTDVTFKNTYTVDMGNEEVTLYHSIAHTFDDVLVHFKENNTVFMGDVYMTNSFPHFYYGGGSKGHLTIIGKALALGNTNTVIVPAHGNLSSNKKELSTYRENSVKWISTIKRLYGEGITSEEISSSDQIKQLSLIFNDGRNVSEQSIQRTIDKTISVDLIDNISISESTINSYEGMYTYQNGQTDEIIYQDNTWILRSAGNYIFELTPLSETKFLLKGQFPNKYITFDLPKQQFIHFNGKENLIAVKD
ncbi:MAG: MBL fold metallo-hydrolase [Balneola sp.]